MKELIQKWEEYKKVIDKFYKDCEEHNLIPATGLNFQNFMEWLSNQEDTAPGWEYTHTDDNGSRYYRKGDDTGILTGSVYEEEEEKIVEVALVRDNTAWVDGKKYKLTLTDNE
jgi:hypothetical protein